MMSIKLGAGHRLRDRWSGRRLGARRRSAEERAHRLRDFASGPNAQGAAITTLSGYKLWVDDVNKRGGLKVQGFDKQSPIEVVEYDDTSNAENAVRLVERLMTQDKVDFVLPPWSTGFNLATRRCSRATAIRSWR